MGNADTEYGAFRTALRTGSFQLAMQKARHLPNLSLLDTLELTLLAADRGDDRTDEMAVRWIGRLVAERRVTLWEVEWATQRLRDAKEGRGSEAGPALRKLVADRPVRG